MITLYFESGAKISEPFCPSTGCLNLSGRSYITVDGGVPCGSAVTNKATCNGTIESTANGTGLANQQTNVVGINVNGTSNVLIENMLIQNMYVHTSVSDTAVTGQPFPSGIEQGSAATSNLTIHDSTLHDANWQIAFVGNGAVTNLDLYNLDVYNSDHCFAVGVTTQADDTILIHDNHCHDESNWDTTADAYHHDGVHVYSNSGTGGHVTNVYIYNNLFDGAPGVNSTSAIFLESTSGSTNYNQVTAYNNVFAENAGQSWANGYENNFNANGSTNSTLNLYNNYFGGPTSESAYLVQAGGVTDSRNNIMSNADTSTGNAFHVNSGTSGTIDYNIYASNSAATIINGTTNVPYATWQGLGYDTHSPVGNYFAAPIANVAILTGVPSACICGDWSGRQPLQPAFLHRTTWPRLLRTRRQEEPEPRLRVREGLLRGTSGRINMQRHRLRQAFIFPALCKGWFSKICGPWRARWLIWKLRVLLKNSGVS